MKTAAKLAPCIALLAACSAGSDAPNLTGPGAGAGGTTPDDSGVIIPDTGGGGTAGSVLNPDSGNPDVGPVEDGDICSAQTTEAEPNPLDVYIMVDQSGSMSAAAGLLGNTTKWQAVVTAFESFLNSTTQTDMSMGIQYFPLPVTPWATMTGCDPQVPDDCGTDGACVTVDVGPYCHSKCAAHTDCVTGSECRPLGDGFCSNDLCDASVYASPEVEIAPLPGVNQAIIDSLHAHGPMTMTPTAPALEGAINHAREWGATVPDHTTIVILATDGMPTVCPAEWNDAQRVEQVKQIAQSGLVGTPPIKTFVIGLTIPLDFIAVGNLNAMAAAGGTGTAFLVDPNQDISASFAAALEAIRGAAITCDFKIPDATGTLDYGKVNVVYKAVDGQEYDVYYVNDVGSCDPVNGGWYYDVPPAQGVPTRILLCPESCTFIQNYGGKIDIAIGCETVVIPR